MAEAAAVREQPRAHEVEPRPDARRSPAARVRAVRFGGPAAGRSPGGTLGRVRWALIAVLAIALTGCGSRSSEANYTRDATAACLGAGFEVHFDHAHTDTIASAATGGALELQMPDGPELIVAFGLTVDNAKSTEAAYRTFAKVIGAPADKVLERRGNAVMWWSDTPTADELEIATHCLKPD